MTSNTNAQFDLTEEEVEAWLSELQRLHRQSAWRDILSQEDAEEEYDLQDRDTGDEVSPSNPPWTSRSSGVICFHRWKATIGFSRVYHDCEYCGAKREEVEPEWER